MSKIIKPPYKLATPSPLATRQDFVTMLIYGPSDTGRSTLALTAPGPMCYTHCAEKVEGLLQQKNSQHVKSFGYPMAEFDFSFPYRKTRTEIESLAEKQWEKLRAILGESLTYARSTINDTIYGSYQLIRYGYFGDLSPNGGRIETNWGPVNQDWFFTFKMQFRNQENKKRGIPNTNLILIAPSTDEYSPGRMGQKTGRQLPDVQKNIYRWSDVVVCTSREEGKFYATIEKPWYNESARGEKLDVTNSRTSFEDVMFHITDDLERWCE